MDQKAPNTDTFYTVNVTKEKQNFTIFDKVKVENSNKSHYANRISMMARFAERSPSSFSSVISTNVGINPQNFLTFSFHPFSPLV